MKTIDDFLKGSKYEGATEGEWWQDVDEKWDTAEILTGYKGKGSRHVICEMAGSALEYECAQFNRKLITDAKRNAVLALLVPELIAALQKVSLNSTEENEWDAVNKLDENLSTVHDALAKHAEVMAIVGK